MQDQGSPPPVVLDLGCGDNKREGAIGIDRRRGLKADIIADLKPPLFADIPLLRELHAFRELRFGLEVVNKEAVK